MKYNLSLFCVVIVKTTGNPTSLKHGCYLNLREMGLPARNPSQTGESYVWIPEWICLSYVDPWENIFQQQLILSD